MIDSLNALAARFSKEEAVMIEQKNILYRGENHSIYSFILGSKSPTAPTFFLVGGVHGLERIGAELCFSYLSHILERKLWDQVLQQMLKQIRLVFIPLLNPVGFVHYKRSNGNDVDLMRNAPINAEEKVPFLIGGQRYSKKLPWYRGENLSLEPENQFLEEIYQRYGSSSASLVALDFHSGFGLRDRLWFPHSYTKRPFDHLAQTHALMSLFEKTYPYHIYKIEPQSHVYHLHGDIWDYLYLKFRRENKGVFIPITLEMGSWNWIKKNPLQLASRDGIFNPIKDHRKRRTLRRHHLLLDFIGRALISNSCWSALDPLLEMKHKSLAMERWYE